MSAAFYPVLEDSRPGVDSGVSGKAIARAEQRLAGIASAAGVTPLLEFFSVAPEEVADLLGDMEMEVPPAKWFSAADGLATVRALLVAVRSEGKSDDSRLVQDLEALERVLAGAAERGARWRLVADY
ncbi:MAG TPA: hypothetical protein VN651_07625 [Gemmatimonadaceae bacterium]|nr:hypothetical protein [Gemmatimonadaceae bacterium]